jgi:formate C-acetyltransferase
MTMVEVSVNRPLAAAQQRTPEAKDPEWRGFDGGAWTGRIDVQDFIHQNVSPYAGGAEFLASATPRTELLWRKLDALFELERARGVLDVSQRSPLMRRDTSTVSWS